MTNPILCSHHGHRHHHRNPDLLCPPHSQLAIEQHHLAAGKSLSLRYFVLDLALDLDPTLSQ